VITGIGHDKDISVTDMVANRSLKTPTAVADFLIDCVANAENQIIEMSSGIINSSRIIIEKNKNRVETSGIKLFPLARIMISGIKDRLSAEIIEIINVGKDLVIRAGLIPANQETRLSSAAKSQIAGTEMVLNKDYPRLLTATINCLSVNNVKVKGLESNLQILNPEKVLLRGFSITSINGKILKNINQLSKDDVIDTQLYDGTMKSRVLETKERKRE
jgi:exodeoxyribonuclease VII large subunit